MDLLVEGVSSAIRLELRPGEWVLWKARPFRFVALRGSTASIRDSVNAELHEVSVAELRGLPSLPREDFDQRVDRLRTASERSWSVAQKRESVIQEMAAREGSMAERLAAAAEVLGVSPRTVRRLFGQYRVSSQTTSLVAKPSGPHQKLRRLGAVRELIIDEAIETHYLIRPKPPMEEAYRRVVYRCRELGVPAPARNSVLRRIRALDARSVARKRMGAKAAHSIAQSTPGMLEAREALELIQMDHTLADVIIVDSRHRQPICRPWLSLAIDVATRCVLGAHVAIEAPSALAVALCMEHACLPKDRPHNLLQSDAPWPMFGMPKQMLVDNGPEFHGAALERGCREYGITLLHRPVARPHYGGHIERLIGTMMGKVHLLPGTTDASPAARGGYDSEATAVLTLPEFARWLSLEIGQYHHHEHRMLGTTPAAAWTDSLAAGVVPVMPAHPEAFLVSFLPVTQRRLQRDGLHFERIRYWSDILPVIAQPREPLIVRYDPRDISRLHVIGKDYHYHTITYANITRPPISLEEVRHAYRTLHAQGNKSTNEARIFEYRAQQRALVASASTATKAMRRKTERLRPTLSITSATSTIDYSQEAVPSAGETWTTSL
jgi:putative transposase